MVKCTIFSPKFCAICQVYNAYMTKQFCLHIVILLSRIVKFLSIPGDCYFCIKHCETFDYLFTNSSRIVHEIAVLVYYNQNEGGQPLELNESAIGGKLK